MPNEISPLSVADETWLQRAEAHILSLLRDSYGEVNLDHSQADLTLCQRFLDEKRVKAKDVLEAQCIGAVLGNVIAARTAKRWKRVKNEYGDMLALVEPTSGFVAYPLTMISKRLEDRREIDLSALCRDFAEIK